jgi:hypothetical protein
MNKNPTHGWSLEDASDHSMLNSVITGETDKEIIKKTALAVKEYFCYEEVTAVLESNEPYKIECTCLVDGGEIELRTMNLLNTAIY